MTKLEAFKLAARILVGAGTATISNSIIQNNVQPANLPQQITVGAASLVLGSMASEAARSHCDTQIDAVVNAWNSRTSSEDPIATV